MSGQDIRVLVVDDERSIRRFLKHLWGASLRFSKPPMAKKR